MFTYEELVRTMDHAEAHSAGRSVWGRELWWYKLGSGEKKLFLNGTHHGNEYITARLCADYYNEGKIPDGWSVYIMPMVNPDGAAVSQGLLPKSTAIYENLRRMNGWNDIYRSWQANANGVDLNHNYDADFSQIEPHGPSRCAGRYPESEPETRAVVNFVRSENFDMVICLHSQGEVIYHGFKGFYPKGSAEIAAAMAKISGYAVEEPEKTASFGGMKDWFVDKFKRPGFTVEVGKGKNPIDEGQTGEIEKRLFGAIEAAMLTYDEVL